VKLSQQGEDESSNYINANWVRDMNDNDFTPDKIVKRAYISTQGPIIRKNDDYEAENVDTCPDFWRMAWECDVEVIVMLTKCSEESRETEKCSQYWPKHQGDDKDYGSINVKLVEKKREKMIPSYPDKPLGEKENICFRTFVLRKGEETRNCTQIQYRGWPDHNIPNDEDEFIRLVDIVDEHNKNGKTLIVHCSAGVGRSGTFCAVHSYIRYLRTYFKEHDSDLPDINVARRLVELRKDRPKMIQTKEQYEYIYKAIVKVFNEFFKIIKV